MTTSSFPPIHKPSRDEMSVAPNLEYAKTRADFDWQQMYSELDWLPGGYLNKAHEAIDRHANGPRRDKIAMIWEGKNGEREDYTFGQLKTLTNRFAKRHQEPRHRNGRPRLSVHGPGCPRPT